MVVFTTAYDEYALRAFEVHALDYLLKPFDSPRFLRTLERGAERLERQRAGDLGKRLLAMVQDLRPEPAHPPDRLVVKSGGRIFFVRTDEIDWIDAAGNYVRLHVKGDSYLFRETMTAMEARLDHTRFVRIHRSHIVNSERIKELQPDNGDYTVILRSGAKLPSQSRVPGQAAGADRRTDVTGQGSGVRGQDQGQASGTSLNPGPLNPGP
jgi:two-component system LytT family response regulator